MTDHSRKTRGDIDLPARIREGDEVAFDTLVRIYAAPLIRHATRILGSADRAEEVVQDVFFDLWSNRSKVGEGWDIAAYLYWATRNQSLKVIRWEKTTGEREGRWVTEHSIDTFISGKGDQRVDESADLRAEVWSALSTVSPRCREIFMLVWDRQLPYKEIATMLGLAEPTVRSQVSRAMKRVVEVLGPRYGSSSSE